MPVVNPALVEVQPYDFRRPPWISRDRRAVLDGVHERITSELERVVGAAVRPAVSVALGDVSQLAFSEWRRPLVTPITAFVAPLAAGEGGEALVLFEPALGCRIADRMLGGSGGNLDDRTPTLTELEQAIVGRLAGGVLQTVRAGYVDVAPFTPGAVRHEAIVESLAIVDRHERVLVLEFSVTIDEVAGAMTVVLPATRIARFAHGRSGDGEVPTATPTATRAAIERVLRSARVPVRARLSSLRLTARESARLEVGQVFAAPHIFAGTVEIDFDGKPAFIGALGKNEERVALRLLERAGGAITPSRLLRRMDPL